MNPTPDNSDKVKLPYFDYLLALIKNDNEAVAKSFGRHVHWGYWQDPELATLSLDDFSEAAENLSEQVCLAGAVSDKLAVLDVGCGFGGTVAHINERYNGMALTGLNLDARQLARAEEMVLPLADNSIVFQQGDACAIPFPDQSFDVVLAVECIFHFPDRKQFFKEAYRVLKPGGVLALSDFVPSERFQPFAKFKLSGWGFYGKCNISHTAADYRKLAADTGFSVTVERNITQNTLPTYPFLRSLAKNQRVANFSAAFETLGVELLSRTGLLHYYIYGFQKN